MKIVLLKEQKIPIFAFSKEQFMDALFIKYRQKLEAVPTAFVRDFIHEIDWGNRFIGIKGSRGVGKTTFLLQYAKLRLPAGEKSLYVSLDDFYFRRVRLYDFAEQFVREGGRYLLLDEVHRYVDWSVDLKNMYDDFPELRVVFTGSSIIHLSRSKADLSRRAVMYHLFGLSFREFLQLSESFTYEKITLPEILENHLDIAIEVDKKIKPLQFLGRYLRHGYYPFFVENTGSYAQKLGETVSLLLELDFPSAYGITYATVDKIKTLLLVLAESVPFKPNIQKLSEQIGLTRNSLTEHLHYLEDAGLVHLLHRDAKGATRLQKPDKIYLGNPNLAFALNPLTPDPGMLRETFFISQVGKGHTVEYAEHGDFRIDQKWVAEVGGPGKGFKQIQQVEHSFVAADGLDLGFERKIPLWLFGFLY